MIFLPKKLLIKRFLDNFNHIESGAIDIKLPDGTIEKFNSGKKGVVVHAKINSWELLDYILKRGDVGLGEAYVEGLWECENLPDLMTFLTANIKALDDYAHGNFFSKAIFFFINNFVRQNTKTGSKKNIRAHYDVGNEFYKLWLDPSMTYSSAIYNNQKIDLHKAQQNKYHRILDKIKNKEHVLEIGCGWGGFMEAATQNHNVTGLTISNAQADFAMKRLQSKGQIKIQDYREEKNKYDAIVSIEMFEAVGERFWPNYFNQLNNCLKDDGKAVIQTISIRDDLFNNYRKRGDYIRAYTFPGGMLPSISIFEKEAKKANLKCKEIYSFGHDYALTLRSWLQNFHNAKDKIKQLGYKEEFLRSWEFYLALCVGGFEAGQTNVSQILIEKASPSS